MTTGVLKSVVVQRLAELASQGTYSVTPAQAATMNALFVLVARVINDLEEEERKIDVEAPTGENNDS